ncbi:MAG: hypothetical protein NTV23_11870 [Propionibacteriales bacterium]|nr:hypothetical protein [Propionibacteriales bacterium]
MTLRRPPIDQRPVRNAAELAEVWECVLAGGSFQQRLVWMLFFDRFDRPVGPLLTLDDLPDGPYDVPTADLVGLCREFIDGPGAASSVAFLMSRPGGDPWTVSDRAWGRFLLGAGERLGGGWPTFWAHRHRAEEFVLR